ncbi:hypothetical protein [Clostridium beijerinckii]|uniref:Uncharacterized protein n=1 Tax=Clostridium beijerinckii TaxID=1520 RepID=A0AAX0B9X7_CLOBE|nr:hypothetical protein [Clostridium beijerinckii]NRT91927.1 hypothetical protein [Clostridium beijerinckii]NYC71453.1 hypothetical protein [Clostridium beijerinckii]
MINSIDNTRLIKNDIVWKTQLPTSSEDKLSGNYYVDSLEISKEGRELAVGVIEHEPAKYFGTSEINYSLNKLLEGKNSKVSKAVYTTIGSNFFPDGTVSDREERSALLEAGLSQAQYIADNYMSKNEATEFMSTMNKIAAIAKTRKVDTETGNSMYSTHPQKPKEAPEDYVNTGELMKRFEPDTYKKLGEAINSGGDWINILTSFVKKTPQHKEWIETYRQETAKLEKDLESTRINSRFSGVDTSNLFSFTEAMQKKIQNTSFYKKDFLIRNIDYFKYILNK